MTAPSSPALDCTTERRRDVLARVQRGAATSGIDFIELGTDLVTLCVHFLGPLPTDLGEKSVVIHGGRRVRGLRAVHVRPRPAPSDDFDDCLEVVLDRTPDGSVYKLCFVALDERGRPVQPLRPPAGFDPRYSCAPFSLAGQCPSDLDCLPVEPCPPAVIEPSTGEYLAKDFASFRRLLLDRLALTVPNWTERHEPDVLMMLVELLAYVGDRLSYYQDAVGTEAYLGTARQRISVRRHARLVDYYLHEGNNARAFVHVHVDEELVVTSAAAFLTAPPGLPAGTTLRWADLEGFDPRTYAVFEPLLSSSDGAHLRPAHNEIRIWTWGDRECCLPEGATSVTLADGECRGPDTEPSSGGGPTIEAEADEDEPPRSLSLEVGDLLLFEERVGPSTGLAADADPTHRHVVRVTSLEPEFDPLFGQAVMEVTWANADALPFPVCVSAVGPPPGCRPLTDVTVVRGNVVLVDHGRTVCEAVDPPVPGDEPSDLCEAECEPAETVPPFSRYRPRPLRRPDLTFAEPLTWQTAYGPTPATDLLVQSLPRTRAALSLAATATAVALEDPCDLAPGCRERIAEHSPVWWTVVPDLLGSGPDDPHVVVEMDDRRRAHLRFGDDVLGEAPEQGTHFTALYRIGNGPDGNVGAGRVNRLVLPEAQPPTTVAVGNPLPAVGGKDPESLDEARLRAPYAFKGDLERAVTAPDYAALATKFGGAAVQGSAAELLWSGSWYEARVAIDAQGTFEPAPLVLGSISDGLEGVRRLGHDVRVLPVNTVALDLTLQVCVVPHQLSSQVAAAVRAELGTGVLPDGRLGFFHPDRLACGEDVRLSRLVAAVQAVEGVQSVEVLDAHPLATAARSELTDGVIPIGALRVARLDNDPAFPEHGRLTLKMGGGR